MRAHRLLLCADLDRTLLPNGVQPESPQARQRLAAVAARPDVTLAYVTGRHKALVQKAISSYSLPLPDFVVADVGTNIYQVHAKGWGSWRGWQEEIATDWNGFSHADLRKMFADLSSLRLQERTKQNTFKLSYYAPLYAKRHELLAVMDSRVRSRGIHASLVWSVDEPAGVGLLDVLPARATQLHAIDFLMRREQCDLEATVFAGDSGNDLPVLISPVHSVLVANAARAVREQAVAGADRNGTRDALYIARGGFHGMNGNYSAGILEGLAHFAPDTRAWWV